MTVTTNEADGATLYNCCTHHAAPDWSQFVRLELGGCIDHDGQTDGGVAFDEAQFFSVYGRRDDGEAEAITDIHGSALDALVVAATLTGISGLTVALYPCGFMAGEKAAIATVIEAATSHLEDLETGVSDGTYDRAENAQPIRELFDAINLLT